MLSGAEAQTPRRASVRPQNVQFGTLVAVDAQEATLKLQPKTGAETPYRLTEKTHILRAKRAAEISEFKTGDSVVVRFRKSAVGPASLYDLADRPSWEWINRLRHETTEIVILEVGDDELKGAEGADKSPIDYRVTDRTQWSKGGKPAAASDFKAGERVFIVPRMLPSGSVMAIGVSDAASGAALLKEHARATVAGTVRSIDALKKKLELHTSAGEDRELALADDCSVRVGSREVPITALHAGLQVTVHLARDADGERTVNRIHVASKKAPRTRRSAGPVPKPAAPKAPKSAGAG